MDTPGTSSGTILQRRKKTVKVGREEILVILRSYLVYPTNWGDVLEDVKQNVDRLPAAAKELYQTANAKQLWDRMSSKLGKLIGLQDDDIEDLDIRSAVLDIREMERRLVRRQSPPRQQEQPANIRIQAAAQVSDEENEVTVPGNVRQAIPPNPQPNRRKKDR